MATPPPSQRWLIGLLFAELVLVQFHAPFPRLSPLQHLPTLAILLAAPWLLRRWPLSMRSLACIVAFFALHTLAGRYIYSYVPYDRWSVTLAGRPLSPLLGWRRNNFDRLVHLAFGLLAISPAREILYRHLRFGPRAATCGAVGFVLAFSCAYEIFEWLLTILLAGPDADAYNGQKDMAMASVGALSAAAAGMWRRTAWPRR